MIKIALKGPHPFDSIMFWVGIVVFLGGLQPIYKDFIWRTGVALVIISLLRYKIRTEND